MLAALALLAIGTPASAAVRTGTPLAAATSSGEIVAAKNHGGALWVRVFKDDGRWGPWQALGGGIQGEPQVLSWGAGHADVYVRGTDNGLWHRWWNGATWAAWERIGSWQISSDPAVISWDYGRIDVFARGMDGAAIHTYFQNGWGGWDSLGGGIVGKPSVVSWGPNHLDVFVRGTDDRLYHQWFGGSGWSGWGVVGDWQISSSPVAISWGSGHIDVYGRGLDGALNHIWYGSASGGWQPWGTLGGYMKGEPTLVSWQWGHIDAFVRGGDDRLYHRWFGSSGWSDWSNVGDWQMAGNPSATTWANGHIDVYATGLDNAMTHIWYGSSAWQGWGSLGLPATSFMGDMSCGSVATWTSGSMLGLSLGMNIKNVLDNRLGTFDATMNCLRGLTAGRAKIGLRMQLRYDSGVPEGNNSTEVDAFGQLITRLANMGISVQPIVSVTSVDFTVCDGSAPGRHATPVGFVNAKQSGCTFPSASAYQLYFNRLVDQVQRQLGNRTDVLYTAWNEPDHPMFTLRWVNGTSEYAATLAGQYWKQARTKLPASRLLAGEFASDGSGTLKSNFQTAAGEAPSNWAYHPYDDMTQAYSTVFPKTKTFQDRLGSAALWLTEIGVKTQDMSSPAGSYARGNDLRLRLGGSTPVRAMLYDLTSADKSPNGAHDSSLTDDLGRARPVMCGLAAISLHHCVGNPAFGGDFY